MRKASVVSWSELARDKRIDAEHYKPEFLAQSSCFERLPYKRVDQVADVSDGNHVSISDSFSDEGVRYLRGQDLRDFFISDTSPVYIPEQQYRTLTRSHMHPRDVLVGIVGTIGPIGFVTERFEQLTGNCKLAIVRSRGDIEPEYLAAYLRSKVGQNEIERRIRGTVQMGLPLVDLKEVPVPLLSSDVRERIARLVREAVEQRSTGVALYKHAESTLIEELRIPTDQTARTRSFVRSLSAVQSRRRLDAEIFQPHVETLMATLGREESTISDFVQLRKFKFVPLRGELFNYVEIGDVTPFGTVESTPVLGEVAPSRATWVVRARDIITSTVRPVRRLTAMIEPEQSGFVCSSGFAVFRATGIPAEVLLVFLRLPVVAELLDLHTTASMYPAISVSDLLSIPLTKPSEECCRNVCSAIERSRAALRHSTALIAEATEIIEQQVG